MAHITLLSRQKTSLNKLTLKRFGIGSLKENRCQRMIIQMGSCEFITLLRNRRMDTVQTLGGFKFCMMRFRKICKWSISSKSAIRPIIHKHKSLKL
jgi:hypothetical protein